MRAKWLVSFVAAVTLGFVGTFLVVRSEAQPQANKANLQAGTGSVSVGAEDIGGVVTSAKGPEAGVWVIAETADLPTKFRKIVVTDEQGRYLVPGLPKANYKVWVRGYGLIDSQPVQAELGRNLSLTAIVAPDPHAASEAYPADYWYSLMQLPPKSSFPMTISLSSGGNTSTQKSENVTEADWVYRLKRDCGACHQLGNKATREIPAALGHFDSGSQAWKRRIESGQEGQGMLGDVSRLGYDGAIAMFADWTDRVAMGELPPAPPRPTGVERNVVITLWDFDTSKSFVHDLISTDKRHPTDNPYGAVYATEWSSGTVEGVDPRENTKFSIKIPVPEVAANFRRTHPHTMLQPSPYWDREVVFDDTLNEEGAQSDSKGRLWFVMSDRKTNPAFCKTGSNNPFAKNFPIDTNARDMEYFDSKTGTFGTVETCFGGSHESFDNDKDETLYMTAAGNAGVDMRFGIGWIKTRVWDETHDAEKSQGWCPAVVDYNGDGKAGAFTKDGEPTDPKLDRWFPGRDYAATVSPVDHSVWYASMTPSPGKLVRMTPGPNPPETCRTEVYQPPFQNPKLPGVEAYFPEGIDVDTNGVVWAALTGTNDLASFDRRKCKVFNGPTATGQQCPEGWTLYPVPGPKFKGSDIPADYFYNNWVDRFNTSGLGNNVSIVLGTNSDSLILFDPSSKKFITVRVPYPLGFYTRNVDGRIDDPKAGWKGRGLWAANETRVSWHNEGGKGTPSYVAHFQFRPDPLAK